MLEAAASTDRLGLTRQGDDIRNQHLRHAQSPPGGDRPGACESRPVLWAGIAGPLRGPARRVGVNDTAAQWRPGEYRQPGVGVPAARARAFSTRDRHAAAPRW